MEEEIKFYVYIKKRLYPKHKMKDEYGIFSISEAFVWNKKENKFINVRINILKGYFKVLKEETYYVVTGSPEKDIYRSGYVLFAYKCCEIQNLNSPIEEISQTDNVCLPKIVGHKMWKGYKTDLKREQEDLENGIADRQKQLHREYNDLKRQARAEVYAELGIKTYSDMRRVLEGWVEDRYKQKLKEAREKSQNPLQTLDKPVQK